MSSVHETAYPRLKDEFTEQELVAIYTPTPEALRFVAARYRPVTLQTLLLIQLKLLQRLGYFIVLAGAAFSWLMPLLAISAPGVLLADRCLARPAK